MARGHDPLEPDAAGPDEDLHELVGPPRRLGPEQVVHALW
jgi:hypothetical protein